MRCQANQNPPRTRCKRAASRHITIDGRVVYLCFPCYESWTGLGENSFPDRE